MALSLSFCLLSLGDIQVRLSERNVVELVNKLKELGVIDASLLHTANGKEYLTREQLRKEILESLKQSGGRTSLVTSQAIARDKKMPCVAV